MSKKIITHSDRFHADDLFAVSVLDLVFKGDIEILRSRDRDIISSGDIVVDVGDIYDPEKGRFDHHQGLTESGIRENGIPYASFGLVWKHFGEQLCSSKEVWEIIENKLVMPIDAGDNGISTFTLTDYEVSPYLIHNYLYSFLPTWKEEGNYDQIFMKAKEIAKSILSREIQRAEDSIEASEEIIRFYEKSENKKIIIFEEDCKFEDEDILSVLSKYEEPIFIVKKTRNDQTWKVKAIRSLDDKENSFKSRKDLPKEWGGLRDEGLQKVTGIQDALFCHRALFMCVARSKESAVKMAESALK